VHQFFELPDAQPFVVWGQYDMHAPHGTLSHVQVEVAVKATLDETAAEYRLLLLVSVLGFFSYQHGHALEHDIYGELHASADTSSFTANTE